MKTPGDMVITHVGVYGADVNCPSMRFDIWDMSDNSRVGFAIEFSNDGPGVFSSWELPVPFRLNYRDEHSTYVMNVHPASNSVSSCQVSSAVRECAVFVQWV